MSSIKFKIIDHTIPCQHVRDYPRALAHDQEDVLHLAVKQYVPLDNPNPKRGDITIIGAHANGFPKELYEPLWDDLHGRLAEQKLRIRGIWISDVAQQGASGVINEELLGNDPSWSDHPRDLLHLINLKRKEMPRPLIGIGHSMGGNHLVQIAYFHPRLFTTLILIDPVINTLSSTPPNMGPNPAQSSTHRRDTWPSRAAAAASFRKSPFYQAWEPRVLDRWIQHGLRDLPTPVHPTQPEPNKPPQVTLTTTKHQEVFTFLRPNYANYGPDVPINRKTHADLNPAMPTIYPFYRAEPPKVFLKLDELRPSALYIFGGKSNVSIPEHSALKVERTGVGVGGSGGVAAGRVKGVTFEEIGHLIPMEVVDRTAVEIAGWVGKEMGLWQEEERELAESWAGVPMAEKRVVDKKWVEMMGPLPGRGEKKKAETKL